MYLVIGTRPDISYNVCKFLDSYGPVHWEAAKRVVRYLKGTHTLRLVLGGEHTAHILTATSPAAWTLAVRLAVTAVPSGVVLSLGIPVNKRPQARSVEVWSRHIGGSGRGPRNHVSEIRASATDTYDEATR